MGRLSNLSTDEQRETTDAFRPCFARIINSNHTIRDYIGIGTIGFLELVKYEGLLVGKQDRGVALGARKPRGDSNLMRYHHVLTRSVIFTFGLQQEPRLKSRRSYGYHY